jgi:hypothetical protein
MEFREFVKLIGKNKYLLFLAVVFCLGAGFFVWRYQANFYAASFSVGIDRGAFEKTDDYKYDQFYRLQADEKFAENITYWANDPGFLSKAKKDFLGFGGEKFNNIKAIKAEQFSSNYLKVNFKSSTKEELMPFYKALKKNLRQKTEDLDYENKAPGWFKLNFGDLAVNKNNPSLFLYFCIALGAGILFGIFLILFVYYFKKPA